MGKNIFIIIGLFIVSFFNKGISQTLTDDQKVQVLQTLQFDGFLSLDSGKQWGNVFEKLTLTEKYKVMEAIPYIEQRIWQCDDLLLDKMIHVLFKLNASNFQNIAKAVIDTSEKILIGYPRKNVKYFRGAKTIRYETICLLFKSGNYTYADKFVQYIQENGGLSERYLRASAIPLMSEFAKTVPRYGNFVKNELLSVMNADTSQNGVDRISATVQLLELKEYFVDDIITYFESTNLSTSNFIIALDIAPFKSARFENSLKTKLFTNQGLFNHGKYAGLLLEYYGSLSNYHFLFTYVINQYDLSAKNDVLFRMEQFIPDTPSVSISINTLLDSVSYYIQQSKNYQWLADASFSKELSNHLDNARNHLFKSDTINCSKEVVVFQDKVNKEYLKTIDNEKKNKPRDKRFVTVEGWKFLYYNAQYIIDRLLGKEKK